MICKHILLIRFLNEPELFFVPDKWFKVLLYDTHDLTSIICLHIVCSIWPIDWTLSDATTSGESEPGSNGNEGVHRIPQIS